MRRRLIALVCTAAVAAIMAGFGGASIRPPKVPAAWLPAAANLTQLERLAYGGTCRGTPTRKSKDLYGTTSDLYKKTIDRIDKTSTIPRPDVLPNKGNVPKFESMRDFVCYNDFLPRVPGADQWRLAYQQLLFVLDAAGSTCGHVPSQDERNIYQGRADYYNNAAYKPTSLPKKAPDLAVLRQKICPHLPR